VEDHPTVQIEDALQSLPSSTREKLPRLFSRHIFREERLFLVLSIVIGIVSGLAVVAFRYSIDWSRSHLLGSELTASHVRLILVPTLIGLVIAALVIHLFPRARGSGVNQTKAALYIYNGYIPFRTAVYRMPESASIASVAPCERAWTNAASGPAPTNDR